MNVLRAGALLIAVLAAAPMGAVAGSQSGGEPRFEAEDIIRLAKKIEREIAARGARVALISRVGRAPEKLPPGIEFTHVAFAVYSRITTSDGATVRGYAVYNLYQDAEEPDRSSLAQDYPVDYFAAVHELRSGVIIPKPELQRRLLEVIFSDTYAALHNPDYSAISNPFNPELQNCTEFVLDVLNAALYDTDDPRIIKANIETYFEPQPVNVDPFKLWLGSIFTRDIRLSDHGEDVGTSTFGSIARYMQTYGIADEVFTVGVE